MSTLPLPLRERRVFVDSSAYLALRDRTDEHHEEAVAMLHALARLRFRQVTSNVIILEAHSLILSSMGIAQGQSFLRDMEDSATTILRARQADEDQARQIVYRYTDKDYSLVDATSFTLMGRLALQAAFTFDRHFRQYGFTQLTPALLEG